MTADHEPDRSDPPAPEPAPRAPAPDAAHLDEDAEALEDPVHSGDARHQHDLHTHPHPPAD